MGVRGLEREINIEIVGYGFRERKGRGVGD